MCSGRCRKARAGGGLSDVQACALHVAPSYTPCTCPGARPTIGRVGIHSGHRKAEGPPPRCGRHHQDSGSTTAQPRDPLHKVPGHVTWAHRASRGFGTKTLGKSSIIRRFKWSIELHLLLQDGRSDSGPQSAGKVSC